MHKNNDKAPRSLGLYIHIPFCGTKCLYCDFCSFVSRNDGERERYIDALCREIEQRGTKEYTVDTVYFGGGTPSLLTVEQISRILCAVRDNFAVCENVEITLECNPMISRRVSRNSQASADTYGEAGGTHTVRPYSVGGYFCDLRRIGINRLSLGIQSAVDSELKLIGRRHTFEEAKRTFVNAREAGFENISVDLMLGIPSQTLETLEISVNELIALEPEHISIYSLQLEEGTPLYRMRERYDIADDDTAADMYELVVKLMREAGYSHYEISNFAKEGRESRHNSKYWVLDEYLGLGLSAHSDFSGKRSENTKDMADYLAGEWIACENEISPREREFEFLMLGLRTGVGISKNEFLARFSTDFDEKYGKRVEKFKNTGYFCENGDRIFLNERGFEVSNAILSELLDFDY